MLSKSKIPIRIDIFRNSTFRNNSKIWPVSIRSFHKGQKKQAHKKHKSTKNSTKINFLACVNATVEYILKNSAFKKCKWEWNYDFYENNTYSQ